MIFVSAKRWYEKDERRAILKYNELLDGKDMVPPPSLPGITITPEH